jgi:hypothetical protein
MTPEWMAMMKEEVQLRVFFSSTVLTSSISSSVMPLAM